MRRLIAAAKARGIVTLIDGAQAVPHMSVDVQELGCDFYAFSGHKLFGPTGIGVLYGREALLERMPPWQGGGDMILAVSFGKTTYNALPYKFEAGTPNISGAIGLGAAVDFLQTPRPGGSAGPRACAARLRDRRPEPDRRVCASSARRATRRASSPSWWRACTRTISAPFSIEDGIAVRTGHHCAMPVMEFFKLPATARASFAFYNTFGEIDRLAAGIRRARAPCFA